MKTSFECSISADLVEKFKLALQLNNEEIDEVVEKMMRQYISNSFSKASQAYRSSPKLSEGVNTVNVDTGKANIRIPKWALKSEQNNHKIVKAFFQVEAEVGVVSIEELEKRCSNVDLYPTTYVRDFRGNFNQMKIDAPKSHGKVFEVKNGKVLIWDQVQETLMEYKKYFQ